ncbi:hypothetical protein A0J61_06501 [Choanephora cucurbitarum]|uniref:PX domain-containing protein n=1 Tax=Choanephora cucurbitarum TaxID=101091 RepID=A0A1C7N959_9FUNG|nr:hypothetical protein A0J61_06501 [Choanephora cucurbitarum]
MNEQSKELAKDIEELERKINDPLLCQKIANAVQTEIPEGLKLDNSSPINETLELLKDSNIEPVLTPQQILKEQESLMSLVFQGVTGEVTKDLFAIFYEPLAQVYKSANISETIGHVSAFVNDLIQVVDNVDAQDASHTAQPFIELVKRHEDKFYDFVHNVHAQDKTKLFDSLLGYVNSIFSFVSTGIPTKIDLDAIVTEAGISESEYPALKQEIQSVCEYHLKRKQRHLERKRQKMMTTSDIADNQEIFDFLPENKQVMNVFNDMAEIGSDSEDDMSIYAESIKSNNGSSSNLKAHEMTLRSPKLHIVPRIGSVFVEHVRRIMY